MNNKNLLFITILCVVAPLISKKTNHRPTKIDDFSRLNSTTIKEYLEPATPQELASIVERARKNNLTVSISGVRHSQGGHAFYPQGVVVSLSRMNKIVSLQGTRLTVQAGATWKEIQAFLNLHNKAVKIMQFANLFTIGGSLSVNANGIDPHVGPLIESVHSFRIMLADGRIVTCSHTENSELFHLAIGGYGLFGIIIEATIEVVENDLYKKRVKKLSLEDYVQSIRSIRADHQIGFHFGQLTINPWGNCLFSSIRSITYTKVDEQGLSKRDRKRLRTLHPEQFVLLKGLIRQSLRHNSVAKYLQEDIDSIPKGAIVSRNTIMSPHVQHLYDDISQETDLLQEYFIPVDNLITFLEACSGLVRAYNINLIGAHTRFIPKNRDAFLSYAQNDCFGVVLLFSQKRTKRDSENTKRWTQSLIDAAYSLGGYYYLPIQLHADRERIRKVYPNVDRFFEAKRVYDPQELFMNHFYQKYR